MTDKRKGGKCTRSKEEPEKESTLDTILKANVANILRKQKAGKTLTANDERILREYFGEKPPTENGKTEEATERVWLTVSEFLRYAAARGVTISRKNFYKTYLDTDTIQRNSEGRIHRDKALETIRIVQNKDTNAGDQVLKRRQEASARVAEARAIREEMDLARERGQLVEIGLVHKIWTGAVENMKNEDRVLEHTLPAQMVGKTEEEIRVMMESANREKWRHLSVEYRDYQKKEEPRINTNRHKVEEGAE
jgi:hypothetical protein